MDRGVWLQGTPGTGKSCMSALLTIEAVKKNKSAWWVSMPELLAKQRRSFELKMSTTPMERALSVDFLVLDDVDKVKVDAEGMFTPWVDEQIWQLFKERCERNMTTVVTTNTLASKWCAQSRNKEPLVSRIKGFFIRFAVSGDDAREQNALAL
jgi:DNA replication protein DnaC